jgi:hypothetical protein
MARSGDWGHFGTVPLEKLPDGVVIPDELKEKVLYDRQLQSLNCYQTLDDHDFEMLRQLGTLEAVTYFETIDRLYRQSRRISTLFLGGGGFIFPRWIESKFPQDPLIHVAELDPAVKAAVQSQMGLPADDQTHVATMIGDARNIVDDRVRANEAAIKRGEQPVLYDFVYGDAFNDFSVPWHLTTKEFSEKIARLVHPQEGIYQVNLIDIYPRTEFPEHVFLPDDTEAKINGEIPHVLTQRITKNHVWTSVDTPYDGLEVERTNDETGYRLAVRGAMSEELRKRLILLGEGKAEFVEAVEKLSANSRRLSQPASLKWKSFLPLITFRLYPQPVLLPTNETGRFLGSYVNTISRVFPHVYLFSSGTSTPHDERDTFVIVASKKHLDLGDLTQNSNHWSGAPFASLETNSKGERIFRGQMHEVLANAHGMVLTDDFAPVDNLLSTVFNAR